MVVPPETWHPQLRLFVLQGLAGPPATVCVPTLPLRFRTARLRVCCVQPYAGSDLCGRKSRCAAARWRWARCAVPEQRWEAVEVLAFSAVLLQQRNDGDVHSATGLGIAVNVQLNCDTREKYRNAAALITY